MKHESLVPIYVRCVPHVPDMKEGLLYISLEFETAIHLCPCGCGNQIVTPLRPNTGWVLTSKENGTVVSLHPSIGNYQIPCKTHYWIRDNQIVWACLTVNARPS